MLRLQRTHQVQHHADFVHLMEVLQLEALLIELRSRHRHKLRVSLMQLLCDHAAHLDIIDAAHGTPLVCVLVLAESDLLHALQDVVFVDVLDVALDASVGGRDDLYGINGHVGEDLILSETHVYASVSG
jgi:hypothetical protein